MRRRRALRICVFLVLGAIVNVAVAWGFAFGPPLSMGLSSGPKLIHPVVPQSSAGESSMTTDSEVWNSNTGVSIYQQVSPFILVTIVSAGWPAHALGGSVVDEDHRNGVVVVPEWTGLSQRVDGGRRWLPWTPVWPGFAINTVFYAAVLWLLFAGPFALRRRRRIRRGLCPKCAYDLRGSAGETCPECGAAVPLSFAAARERARVREPTQ